MCRLKRRSDKIYYVNLMKEAKLLERKDITSGKEGDSVSEEVHIRREDITVKPEGGSATLKGCPPLVPSQQWPLNS